MLSKIMYFVPIAVIVVSTLFYHIAQKSTPVEVSPLISLFTTYLFAALVCLGVYPFLKHEISFLNEFKKVNWTSFILGISVLGIELGVLYAYRIGWNIGKVNLCSNSIAIIMLIFIGVLFYHEKVTMINGIGMLLCIVGIFLINK